LRRNERRKNSSEIQISTTLGYYTDNSVENVHLPGAPEFIPVFNGVGVTRSLVLCVCFVDRCLSFYAFSFDHCVFCSSNYGFWLPLWYLQTLLINQIIIQKERVHISISTETLWYLQTLLINQILIQKERVHISISTEKIWRYWKKNQQFICCGETRFLRIFQRALLCS
jgi:hypothetical protein